MNLYFDTSAYDGAVSSGQIRLVPHKLRGPLAVAYSQIKTHNRYSQDPYGLEDPKGPGGTSEAVLRRYEMVEGAERSLSGNIPILLQGLEEFRASIQTQARRASTAWFPG